MSQVRRRVSLVGRLLLNGTNAMPEMKHHSYQAESVHTVVVPFNVLAFEERWNFVGRTNAPETREVSLGSTPQITNCQQVFPTERAF